MTNKLLNSIRNLSGDSFLRRIEHLSPAQRRAVLALRVYTDVSFFATHVVESGFRLPFAPLHERLFRWHGEMGADPLPRRRGRHYALAAPRGSAKSTIVSFLLPLHDIVCRREEYIVLLSATQRQAQERLRAIRRELESGPAGAFARSLGAAPGTFSARSLHFAGIQVDAYGAGSEIRGVSAHGYRPTKIILDDAEASRAATSARARERLAHWYHEVVEYLGDVYTHILAIGTVLHEQGLLAELMRRPDFESIRTRSIESFATDEESWEAWRRRLMDFGDGRRRETARAYFEEHRERMLAGTRVLWPEKEDYEDLMAQLVLGGRRSFYQEKQNAPLGAEEALFDGAGALRGVEDGGLLRVVSLRGGVEAPVRTYREWRVSARRFGYLDAAMGKRARSGDFAALASVWLLPDGSFHTDALWARRAAPSAQVARILEAHGEHPFERVAIEGTGFQELMLPLLEEASRAGGRTRPPVEVVHPKAAKATRIAALEPLLTGGALALSPGLDEEFWEELESYPSCAHDDALDALAGAVEMARGARGRGHAFDRVEGCRTSREVRY